MTMQRVTLDHLNAVDGAGFVVALGDVFEHSPWIAEEIVTVRPFLSLAELFVAMRDAVQKAGVEKQTALIKAHPDLAGKAARAGTLTADSTAEQSSAGLDRLNEEEFAAFHRANAAYRAKFGIPFIVCVRRHTKVSILREFARRLDHDVATEHATALAEIFRIVALRLDQRVDAPDKLPVHGRLSTHVLDTHGGRPAAGVAVELYEIEGDAVRLVERATTNADGRTDNPLIGGRPVPIGEYELRFYIGAYFFAGQGTALPQPAFLGIVPVRFSVAEAEGHYHVPLLASPWSYTTYRGS
jgi:2-oxo-4-hydroxy-4-carboxy-5-ureidoimidazoline decarboxylase